MSILDEIKKKAEYYGEFDIRKGVVKEQHIFKAVKLSDIEKILGEMKCEKCVHWLQYKNEIGLGECRYLTAKTTIDIIDTKPDFFCSQFEVKE